ncbi:Ras-related and estrogen-regulated growth inhibitor, partial [Cyphomyrmex costatus]
PDVAPSDYHLFWSMQHGLFEQHFSYFEDIKKWLDDWIASKKSEFFYREIYENGCLYSHIRWGEAFVVVYSVTCKRSFQEARGLLKQLADLRLPSYFTALLLGNKRDLDHAREVCVDEGQQLSLAHGCQFYEVSAAESPAGAALAFQALLREARSVQLLRALPIRRKLGVHSVSRVLGTIFGKNTTKDRKKRPSLSI